MSLTEPERVFLGWSRPVLHTAVDWFVERFRAGTRLDLQHVLAVFPAKRAARRFVELLVERASERGLWLTPPRAVTPDTFAAQLLPDSGPLADTVAQRFAWMHALRSDRTIGSALLSTPPAADDWVGWSVLADLFLRLHAELAGHLMSFADVATATRSMSEFQDRDRWEVLAALQAGYLDVLRESGVSDPQLARIEAIARGAVRADAPVVLVACADLQPVWKNIVLALGHRATALVGAPDEFSHGFDACGCLLPDAWSGAEIAIDESRVRWVEGAGEQAQLVATMVRDALPDRTTDDIVIAVSDPEDTAQIAQRLEGAGIVAHDAAGRSIDRSPIHRALRLASAMLEHGRFTDFAALVRHPDVERHCRNASSELTHVDWLSALDQYATQHVPFALPASWPSGEGAVVLNALRATVDAALSGLKGPARTVAAWGPEILGFVLALYGDRPMATDDAINESLVQACEVIGAAIEAHAALPANIRPVVTGATAIDLLLHHIASDVLADSPRIDAVELLGWLDLPLDDARVAIVTGLSEGRVPEFLNADAFLPNALRRHLKITDNVHRYARDAYALHVVRHTRPDAVLLCPRRDGEGNPVAPSRLLLASDAMTVARRITAFYRDRERTAVPPPPVLDRARLSIPRPKKLENPIVQMSVSWFKDYLACPYRFYLKRIRHLEPLDDHALELDHAQFGTLAHDVLFAFGTGEERGLTDANALADVLSALLDRLVGERLAAEASPAVRVQVEQLRERLRDFAVWQATWARDGWQIAFAERGFGGEAVTLRGTDPPMGLRGRIDRIDVNARTGEWVVFDYKTSDHAQTPEASHRKRGVWTDLQLPLYAHVVEQLAQTDPILGTARRTAPPRLGYLRLPSDRETIGEAFADWTEDDLAEAMATARDVATKVRAEVFWPPADPPPAFSEPYAAICQDGQRRARDPEPETEE